MYIAPPDHHLRVKNPKDLSLSRVGRVDSARRRPTGSSSRTRRPPSSTGCPRTRSTRAPRTSCST
ncbi:hypothetical protein GT044_17425 [Streptomyces sp. SID335]|nr:hypothetical protein [Streptomyces sp. SID335]MYZ17550.1 hypothetical protein [Streptomyces sp. SID337]NDZ86095.1 hypothetical protein [Streptomyces sp. SID10115]NEA05261.1 hypothetical protein [Streptomyces sp. SID10116]NEB50198.1 hypothetical protein [Streptomyces sp. SID339]